MKKALLKDSLKEIKNTYKRFISILLMAFLGVGFFAGLRAAAPDMVDTIDEFYDKQNVYDIQIISTLGLTGEDIEELSKIENVENVYGSYETDGKIKIENKEIIAKIITLSGVNNPILLEGRLPQNAEECLVEENFLKANNKKIGDKVVLDIQKTTNDDGEEIDVLKNKELTITGTIKSPLYISRDRGSSNLGAGKIDYYMYVTSDNIYPTDIYTNIYISIKDAKKYTTSSEKYEDYIEEVKQDIEQIKEQRENKRQEALIQKAQNKVNEAENELNTQKSDGQSQIDEATQKIEDAKLELQNAEEELNQKSNETNRQFAQAETEIQNAKNLLIESKQTLEQNENNANQKIEELENQKIELQKSLNQINSELDETNKNYNLILELLKNEELTEEQKAIYEAQKTELEKQITTLTQTKAEIEEKIEKIDAGISSIKQELETAKCTLETQNIALTQKEEEYNSAKQSAYSQIEQARIKIDNSKQEIASSETELNEKKQEFDEKIEDAEEKLLDAKEKILEIEKPTWYVLDRNGNVGYANFIQDTKSVENISNVFPIVFFIVAALISLTSMTRMVEEQRSQLGILKALGYNSFQITQKYIIYASCACIIGGFLGMCVGFVLLPKILWSLYGMMYQISDNICISFNFKYGTIGLILICVCILGATIYTVWKELKNDPAVLMRPKAPKSGNRVFLEKIQFIWKKLNFSSKVTVRNLFRYKKRFYMTIIGILGCTALILTGFGIKDSVTKILPNQFEKVFCYDMQITMKNSLSLEEKQAFIEEINKDNRIEKIAEVYMTSGEVANNDNLEEVQIIIPEEEQSLDEIININNVKTHEKVSLKENQICLTDKAAQLLEVKQGDSIILKESDDKEIEIKISDIVENYVNHYVFMSKSTYETLYEETYNSNVLLIKNVELSDEKKDELATDIISKKEVAAFTDISSFAGTIGDMMTLLNYVVIILIVSAGLLAFVVLYNLSNVNISERIRELATIKVLGFYDKEVYDYVTRETVILTIIGIILGLGAGYLLNAYILGTCEINILRFTKTIDFMSYIYAAGLTIIFTVIVNIVTYFSLKRINMIESLKSVE